MKYEDIIHTQTYKMYTMIVKEQEKQTIEAIKKYCEENGIIPNIIDEEKLKQILQLGINEYTKIQITGSDKE